MGLREEGLLKGSTSLLAYPPALKGYIRPVAQVMKSRPAPLAWWWTGGLLKYLLAHFPAPTSPSWGRMLV
jgi:hypothetical protein